MLNSQRKKSYYIIGACIAIYLCAVTGFAFWSNHKMKQDVMNDIDSRLLITAGALKYMLAPDFHDRATGPGRISFSEEMKNRRIISSFISDSGCKLIYTLAEADGRFYFTAPAVSPEEAAQRKSWYFYPYDDIPQDFIMAWKNREIRFVDYTDHWGSFRSIAIPVISPGGRLYLACADIETGSIEKRIRDNTKKAVFISLYFLFFSIPFILAFRFFFTLYNRHLKKINIELNGYKQHLELLVDQRTSELSSTRDLLRKELQLREESENELRNEKIHLEEALNEVKVLSGLVPICSSCKKIRDDNGYWNQLEKYIQEHSGARFSHGLCPDCVKKLYPDLKKNRLEDEPV